MLLQQQSIAKYEEMAPLAEHLYGCEEDVHFCCNDKLAIVSHEVTDSLAAPIAMKAPSISIDTVRGR